MANIIEYADTMLNIRTYSHGNYCINRTLNHDYMFIIVMHFHCADRKWQLRIN
jgi:hypothetical protein